MVCSSQTISSLPNATGKCEGCVLPVVQGGVTKKLKTDSIAAQAWKITGNSGIDTSVNFLGTIDDKPLQFKVFNFRSGFINHERTSFGYKALAATTVTGGTTGSTAVGGFSAWKNTTGDKLTAVGKLTLAENLTGNDNTALGWIGGRYNTTGNGNLFLGSYSGVFNTTQSNQIFINTISRANYGEDTSLSPIYAVQAATIGGQRIRLNGNTTVNGNLAANELRLASGGLSLINASGSSELYSQDYLLISSPAGVEITAPGSGTTYDFTVGTTLLVGSSINAGSTIRVGAFTVSTLPAAGTAGRMAYVTDATAPTYLGTLTGGGSVKCPVFDNGTAWVSH